MWGGGSWCFQDPVPKWVHLHLFSMTLGIFLVPERGFPALGRGGGMLLFENEVLRRCWVCSLWEIRLSLWFFEREIIYLPPGLRKLPLPREPRGDLPKILLSLGFALPPPAEPPRLGMDVCLGGGEAPGLKTTVGCLLNCGGKCTNLEIFLTA